MATKKKVSEPKTETPKKTRTSKPAMNPESREKQLVSLAVDLVEKQLREGTAAPSIINHYLKLATRREVLEREILEKQAKFIEAKAQNITQQQEGEQLAKEAIEAMRTYGPRHDDAQLQ